MPSRKKILNAQSSNQSQLPSFIDKYVNDIIAKSSELEKRTNELFERAKAYYSSELEKLNKVLEGSSVEVRDLGCFKKGFLKVDCYMNLIVDEQTYNLFKQVEDHQEFTDFSLRFAIYKMGAKGDKYEISIEYHFSSK